VSDNPSVNERQLCDERHPRDERQQSATRQLPWWIRLSLPARCGLLAFAVGLEYLVVGVFAAQTQGPLGWEVTGLAALICGTAGLVALIVARAWANPKRSVAGILGSHLIRFGVPLSAGVLAQAYGGRWHEAGLFSYLVVFYLGTWAIETPLSLPAEVFWEPVRDDPGRVQRPSAAADADEPA